MKQITPEELTKKLMECGWIEQMVTKDIAPNESRGVIQWTKSGQIALLMLKALQEHSAIRPVEIEVILAWARDVGRVQRQPPPRFET